MTLTETEKKVETTDSTELEEAAKNGHDEQSASFTKTEDVRQPARFD